MQTSIDSETLILAELEELFDVPLECEHSTHGNPEYGDIHDDNGAAWYASGTHSCGRHVEMYMCDTLMVAGMSGKVQIICSQCREHNIPFEKYYPVRTAL